MGNYVQEFKLKLLAPDPNYRAIQAIKIIQARSSPLAPEIQENFGKQANSLRP
ncbi:hypothetical protein G7B40_028490 [Aetokthonos hydrillicola Thurmond2011]|jgi:hypothetical protein|uniref:Uncharacterized protein n=1 Tax=Aetokthonos hydrillicola Thurmond2011 TaxID=2712845 RepID=A0AAP5IF64_9CYAN|nr:hypothetical protein [Aetokthonos hydrillicola]MBO3458103.1 hypothetical protein [Aetokthonos hydrillicola CCALA 1050]MBW4584324.1 hypothetical protein [Aetokthonos hydrillicola CCALA 1050]MDR9898468.1 hypothetical protein [Aetokthonos hydrillicola Thurmond2011]